MSLAAAGVLRRAAHNAFRLNSFQAARPARALLSSILKIFFWYDDSSLDERFSVAMSANLLDFIALEMLNDLCLVEFSDGIQY